MAHCCVLTCDNESTKLFAFWLVCDGHHGQLEAGAEFRRQGSETSATGMAPPALVMGQQLLDLNEYLVLEPPTELIHDSDCPEGTKLPLRVRQFGGTETDLTLILPNDVLQQLAELLRPQLDSPLD